MSELPIFFLTQWDRVFSKSLTKASGRRRVRRTIESDMGRVPAQVELLERKVILSAANVLSTLIAVPTFHVEHLATPHASTPSSPSGYSPSQIQAAYGFNKITNNGAGQTIAIVDAYHAPTIQSDLQAFDAAFGIANPPSLTVMSQTGSTTTLPPTDPTKNWEVETSLDVEWAHALAPGAKIVLVEANSASYSDLFAAVQTAAKQPGVSVVSMSWGGGEFSSEASYDSIFTTPAGHQGVTFVASTGDNGAPGGFPAYSPNVLAVGGTTLNLNSSGAYVSESGWSGSGGGISSYESQPAYQKGIVTQTTTKRANPDVSFDADPNTGVAVYDSFTYGTSTPWVQVGGTSFSAPAWGAVIALIDQSRVQNGLGTLDGATQTLPMLYQLDKTNPSAFHDVTTGSNGFAAGTGYDLVTGLGTPIINVLVPAMSGATTSSSSKLAFQQSPTSGTAGTALGTVSVAIQNQNGQIVTTDNSKVTLSISSGSGGFTTTSIVSVNAVNGVATFSNLTLNVSGSYKLSANDGSLTGATSNTITITAAQAAKVVFQQVPTSGTTASALPLVTVAVVDQFGNVVTTNNSTVTISVASGPGGFASGSTTSATAVNGIATFKNLILGTAGTYTLAAVDGSLTRATSTNVIIGSALSAPTNVTASAVNSTTAQLAWGAASGTQGYRVYQIIGSQTVLLGTVSATTTSVQITGLTAGSTASFKVEAYNSTTVADSPVVSVTLPAVRLSTPVVTITALTSTSLQLNWTASTGAQGYRVYVMIGTTRSLLGTVSSTTTSCTVAGLTRGTTYQFQVEAFAGSTVQDSAWVTVTAPSLAAHFATASATKTGQFDNWDFNS